MKQQLSIAIAVVLGCAACGGGDGGGADDTGGDDTGSEYGAFLSLCHDARASFASLGCSPSDEDLCGRDVEWLQQTGDACYDELVAWWECIGSSVECDGFCSTAGVDCISAFCEANPDNPACTGCTQFCPPPPPP